MPDVVLFLEDGKRFLGNSFGYFDSVGRVGEIVFNTSMSGYQEIITDPSYRKQFVIFTYPSIGNYGVNFEDEESDRPYLEGIVVRDYCERPSNFRMQQSLHDYLLEKKVLGISGIDTRQLVRHIREKGSMKGGIFPKNMSEANMKETLNQAPDMQGANLTDIFDGENPANWVLSKIEHLDTSSWPKILVLDFGIKRSILRNFIKRKVLPVVVGGNKTLPPNHPEYDGYFFSNGPGDPASVIEGIQNIKILLKNQKPTLGICLGHQIASLALGAKTFKMKFGHHGANQPVKASHRKNIIITSQNHGFAVDPTSLQIPLDSSEISSNDHCLEGYTLKNNKLICVQYHPEANPGPNDAQVIFDEFKAML